MRRVSNVHFRLFTVGRILVAVFLFVGSFIIGNNGFHFSSLHAESSNGVFQSFIANRLTTANPNGLSRANAAFWDATRLSPGSSYTFCESQIPESVVVAVSIIDSPALNRVFDCPYVSNALMVHGLSPTQATYTFDGNPLPVKKQPASGARPWTSLINPNNDTVALTCDDFNLDFGGVPEPGEQCFGITFGVDITELLTPGTHTGVFTFIHPDEVCGINAEVTSTITIDASC